MSATDTAPTSTGNPPDVDWMLSRHAAEWARLRPDAKDARIAELEDRHRRDLAKIDALHFAIANLMDLTDHPPAPLAAEMERDARRRAGRAKEADRS